MWAAKLRLVPRYGTGLDREPAPSGTATPEPIGCYQRYANDAGGRRGGLGHVAAARSAAIDAYTKIPNRQVAEEKFKSGNSVTDTA